MDTGSDFVPTDRQDVGFSHSGPVCITIQHPTATIHIMEARSTGTSNKCSHSTMDTREQLCLPSLGTDFTVLDENTERAVDTHSGDPLLAVSNMVPNSEEPSTAPTTLNPIAGSSRTFSRWDSARLDTGSMAHQRQRLTKEGASAATVKVMTESTLASTRQWRYKGPQAQWILHCSKNSIDPFNPSVVELLNFLAHGIETKQWSSGTVNGYRSAILNLFPDCLSYWNNSTFCDFFRHLSSNEIKHFTNMPVDISPVLDHFRTLGPNAHLKPNQLLPKLCWLLAVCGFMCPSDIQHVDVSHSSVQSSGELELQVVGPKEKRAGRHIIKSVFIHPHEDPLVCPVATYQCYVAQLSTSTLTSVKHPFLDQTLNPLIRHIFDINQAASSDTIGCHIARVSDLLPLPLGLEKAPSGRSLSSSLAIEHGASSDEVQAQGFWAHSATYDSFYRLSCRSVKNLTQITLAS
ncbi:hypothetical protein MVEG_10973 [Podila verticillata NRRL 6337]|nr:hypothetical protein MVEG_10973 [Podila verticillata NRRL 6337]